MGTYLEDYIQNLYKLIGVTIPSELEMPYIARKLGVKIVYRTSAFRFGNEIILVRGTKCEEWMEFGHEICHYLRHCGNQANMHPLFAELQEWQAENFMYHFCVPTFMLQKLNLPRNRKKAIWEIQKNFNVSYEFAEIRLEKFTQKHAYAMFS